MKKNLTDIRKVREEILCNLDPLPLFSSLEEELTTLIKIYEQDDLALYIFNGEKYPNLMNAVGVEREIAFRMAGGGSGKKRDIDQWDIQGYSQIICVDFKERRIVGGYRFALGRDLLLRSDGDQGAVERLFHLSPTFKRDIFAHALELGRSFVDATSEKSAIIMDILWYGLGYMIQNENFNYFLGKVTFYPNRLTSNSLDILDYFLEENFGKESSETTGPKKNSLYQRKPITQEEVLALSRKHLEKAPYQERRRNLFKLFNQKKQSLRPFMLLFKYLSLGELAATVYGGAINTNFGDVVEVMFTIQLDATSPQTIKRYITPILNAPQR